MAAADEEDEEETAAAQAGMGCRVALSRLLFLLLPLMGAAAFFFFMLLLSLPTFFPLSMPVAATGGGFAVADVALALAGCPAGG